MTTDKPTEAMIEAGCCEADDWGETERRGADFVAAIYTAMHEARSQPAAASPDADLVESVERIEEELRAYRKRGINPDTIMVEVKGSDLRRLLARYHFPNADWDALRALVASPSDSGGSYPLQAHIWKRDNEWVLEISGIINDCNFTSRHTEPLTTAPEDVAGLPSLYATHDSDSDAEGGEA
jgi:hypothetical protein